MAGRNHSDDNWTDDSKTKHETLSQTLRVWDIFFTQFRKKLQQLLVEYHVQCTTKFETSFFAVEYNIILQTIRWSGRWHVEHKFPRQPLQLKFPFNQSAKNDIFTIEKHREKRILSDELEVYCLNLCLTIYSLIPQSYCIGRSQLHQTCTPSYTNN
jgi:hypothetical protein